MLGHKLVQRNIWQGFCSVTARCSVQYLLLCPATYEVQIWMANCISNTREEKEMYSKNDHVIFLFQKGSHLDSWKVKRKLNNSFHTSEVCLG